MIQIGQTAPDFKLYSSDKEQIALSDFKGKKVLILFFPYAFTGTCTKELCMMRDELGMYSSLNVQILAISIDTVYTLDRFKKENQYNFPLLSDFNKEASRAYGSLYEVFNFDNRGVAKRSAFLVDEEGKIKYAEVLENASLIPDFESIKRCL